MATLVRAVWRALGLLHRHANRCEASTRACPDHQLTVIARDDDTTFGILHSRFQRSGRSGLTSLLIYTPTTTFATFPFPPGLAPDVPATEYASDPRPLRTPPGDSNLRDRWLNPPEGEWVDEPVSIIRSGVPRDEEAALKKRTLTCPPAMARRRTRSP